jgi:hypothetical protein
MRRRPVSGIRRKIATAASVFGGRSHVVRQPGLDRALRRGLRWGRRRARVGPIGGRLGRRLSGDGVGVGRRLVGDATLLGEEVRRVSRAAVVRWALKGQRGRHHGRRGAFPRGTPAVSRGRTESSECPGEEHGS